MMLIPVRPAAGAAFRMANPARARRALNSAAVAFLAEAEHQHVQVHQHGGRLIDWLVGNDGFHQHKAGVITHRAPA